MNCKQFKIAASAYLDDQLGVTEAIACHAHLESCADCRAHAAELREVSKMLGGTGDQDVPLELHSYIMVALERRNTRDISFRQMLFEWVLRLNPLPVSYLTGALVSVIMFSFVLSGMKPISILGSVGSGGTAIVAAPAVTGPAVTGSKPEFENYNDLPTETAADGDQNYYELPRLIDNGSIVGFSHITYSTITRKGMSALVEISPEGQAKLVEVLDGQPNPVLVEQLWWSLGNPTFQPARVDGRAVSTRIVLFVEQTDVNG